MWKCKALINWEIKINEKVMIKPIEKSQRKKIMKVLNNFEYVQDYLPLYTTNVKYKVAGWVVYNKRIILNNKLKKDLTNHFVLSGLKTDSVFTTEEKEIKKVNFITKKLNNYASPWKFNRLYNFYYSNLSFFKKLKLWEWKNNDNINKLIALFFVNKNLVLFIDNSKFILNKLSVLQIKNKFRYYQVNSIDQFNYYFLKNNKKENVKNHINFAKHLRYLKKYNVGSHIKRWKTWRKVNLWRKSILNYNLKPTSYNKFKAPKYMPYFLRRIKRLYLKKIC